MLSKNFDDKLMAARDNRLPAAASAGASRKLPVVNEFVCTACSRTNLFTSGKSR